jgi:hypothetical protein
VLKEGAISLTKNLRNAALPLLKKIKRETGRLDAESSKLRSKRRFALQYGELNDKLE